MNNIERPFFINRKPSYTYEFKIDESRELNAYLTEYLANEGTLTLKVYNDTSVEVYKGKELKGKIYLTGLGICDVKVKLAGIDIEARQNQKACKQFSQELRNNRIGSTTTDGYRE